MIYKVIGNRKMAESEVRELLAKGQIGPLDGFRSKAGKPFSAVLRYNKEEKKAEFVFDGQRDATGAIKIDFTGLQPVADAPAARFGPGAQVYETPQSYVVRRVENGEDKILARCSRRILSRDIPLEQFMKMLETGKTDLLDKFWSHAHAPPLQRLPRPQGGREHRLRVRPARRPRTRTPRRGAAGRGRRPLEAPATPAAPPRATFPRAPRLSTQ